MNNSDNKGIIKFLFGLLSNNLGLKIASLIFAVILWGFVMTEINPPREKTFENISLKYENSNNLAEKELVISDNLDDVLKTVEITVEANPDYLYFIDAENINAYVDLSLINGVGAQTVAIKATSLIGTVVGIKPKTVTINVEDLLTRTIPVTHEIKNALLDNYYMTEPIITPETIEIKGARSFVESVSTAVCYIDLHETTESIKESYPITFRDENGEIVESNKYKEDLPSVIVDIEVMPQKAVPINFKDSVFGVDNLAEGFIATNYWVEPSTVLVAAEQSILDTIVDVQIEGVDISGAKTNLSIQTNIKPVDGAVITADPKGIFINVDIMAQNTTRIFEAVKVEAINGDEDFDISIVPANLKVILSGEETILTDITSKDVNVIVDLEGKGIGEYSLPVQVDIIEGIDNDQISLPIDKVKVVISEKE